MTNTLAVRPWPMSDHGIVIARHALAPPSNIDKRKERSNDRRPIEIANRLPLCHLWRAILAFDRASGCLQDLFRSPPVRRARWPALDYARYPARDSYQSVF